MPYLRAVILIAALIGFCVVGVPVQTLALAGGWRLGTWIPGFFHRVMCRIIRVHVRFRGTLSPAKPLLIVSNHVSWLDISVLSVGEPVCFLAKREMKSWPVFGLFAVLQGSVFVDRARRTELPKVNAEIADRLRAGGRVVIFAESTTSDGAALLRFRAAHFDAARVVLAASPDLPHVMIQPVALAYASRDGHTKVAWWGDMPFLPDVWALLNGGPYDCTISFGEPIAFTRSSDRKTAALATEAAVRGLLAVPGASRAAHA